MRAYRGVIEDGVVQLLDGARLPEGTFVTVTVGEAELLRATITSAFRRPRKVRVRLKPVPGLVAERAEQEERAGPGERAGLGRLEPEPA